MARVGPCLIPFHMLQLVPERAELLRRLLLGALQPRVLALGRLQFLQLAGHRRHAALVFVFHAFQFVAWRRCLGSYTMYNNYTNEIIFRTVGYYNNKLL